ncbi:purine-cytosine permease-like transporter [Candidatus Nitrososphaera evergladensis SR1]|jgi:cytosine permease|uniref:Purine-cytosine permease-like transporter n=1 Tax=Candidatus Nitrososphaera evergladensis SR1 TaxID=1459636 RepID=A0A075MN08_9ARCH|nr:cytosine permease [Candidatus Nitrososphaera evergladensis]AIF82871.1 purine-cytosine permease-like transporter [Candidatus Nitrososphaera evergladensis SR1]
MVEQEEYAERPVPEHARLGFMKPTLVWAGFTYAYICIFIGSQIMGGLGAPMGYVAIIAGQVFLFGYAGLIAHKSSKLGLNFPMMCKAAFGRYAYALPVLMIAGLVTGWYAFQAWLAADLMVGLYGGQSFNAGTGSGVLPGILGTTGFWAGVFAIVFGMFAVYGVRAMAWMGWFAVISVTALAGWMIYSIVSVVGVETGGNLFSSQPIGEPWTFAMGFTASVGTFIVSATMTGDFNRWTKSVKQSWGVIAVAFLAANMLMLMTGGIFTAVAGKLDFFFGLGTLALGIPIMIIQWASNGSTCDGCMYNATQGFKNVVYYISGKRLNFSWKKMAIIVMIAGTAVAAANLLTSIVPWLLLLGSVVPLVGGILIGHFWIVARKCTPDELLAAGDKKINGPAVTGFLAGLAIAIGIQLVAPDLPAVLGGLIGGVGVYPLVAKITGYTKGGRLTPKGLGTSASYGAAGTADQPPTPSAPGSGVAASGGQASPCGRIDRLVEFMTPFWSSLSYRGGGGSQFK